MTYCLAIRVDEGLVFASDSRTNAGADQISTYSKMDRFGGGRERTLTLLSSGNLATCQGVVTRIKRDIRSSARVNLMNVEDLQAAAEYVGSASPHFSPGAVMIAEDFGPVYTRPVCTRGQKTREGLRAKRGRARPAQSAIGTIIDIAVKLVKPKSFLTPTSGLVRNAG